MQGTFLHAFSQTNERVSLWLARKCHSWSSLGTDSGLEVSVQGIHWDVPPESVLVGEGGKQGWAEGQGDLKAVPTKVQQKRLCPKVGSIFTKRPHF